MTNTPTNPQGGTPSARGGTAGKDKAAAPPVPEAAPVDADLKKKELIDLVVARSGIKKKDAKPVVETMLAVLGESVAQGRALNLQPLGKLRITRTEDRENGRVFVCKLRQSGDAPRSAKDPLAATAE